jgi:hypothetical protein
MALPWLAVGKFVLANFDTIVGVVKPAFTRRKAVDGPPPADLVDRQIAELQAASTANTERIAKLAGELQAVAGTLRRLTLLSLALSVSAIIAALAALLLR